MLLLWQLLYPIIIYEMISAACVLFLNPADMLWGQGASAAATALVLVPFYMERRKGMYPGSRAAKSWVMWLSFLTAGAASSIFLNSVMTITGLNELLTDYEEVSDMIYASPLGVQIFAAGLLIPAAEEMIFRGLGYETLRVHYSMRTSMLVSAFLFGAFHGNLQQGIYAFLVGLVLAWCCETGGGVWASYLAHSAANIASVLIEYVRLEDVIMGKQSAGGVLLLLETVLSGLCLCAVIKGYTTRRV